MYGIYITGTSQVKMFCLYLHRFLICFPIEINLWVHVARIRYVILHSHVSTANAASSDSLSFLLCKYCDEMTSNVMK